MLAVPRTRIRKAKIVIADGEYIGTTLRFPHNPATLSETNAGRYADHDIFGRSRPTSQYTGGAVRMWNFELPVECISEAVFQQGVGFKAGPIAKNKLSSGKAATGSQRILQIVNFLRALKEPRKFLGVPSSLFSEGVPVGPPFFLFLWGDNFSLRCRMRSVDVDWQVFNYNLEPAAAFVKCQMAEHPEVPPTFEDAFRFGNSDSTFGGG